MVTKKLVPPDGGYGWAIVGSFALHYFVAIPVMQGFGLIFKDSFRDLGFTATDSSIIMNVNSGFSMFIGIINAPLLKHLGYRKVAFAGATFVTIGVTSTAFANSFAYYIITYGFITAGGIGMGLSAYSFALNSYFSKRRSKATGYAMTLSGFGPVIMPQVISFLLDAYGTKGGVIILGALTGHTFVSAMLLQPIEWHKKVEFIEDDTDEAENEKLLDAGTEEDGKKTYSKKKSASMYSLDDEGMHMDGAFGLDTPLAASMMSLYSAKQERSMSVSSRRRPLLSLNSKPGEENLKEGNTILFEEDETGRRSSYLPEKSKSVTSLRSASPPANKTNSQENLEKGKSYEGGLNGDNSKVYNSKMSVKKEEEENDSLLKRIGKHIVDIFDLNLLRDATYVNIVIGMSFAVFAEINFSILTPFIMADYDLDTQQIATFMSTISILDICFRFIAPYVSDYFQQPIRIMYLWALFLLMISRFTIIFATSYTYLLFCAAFLGLAKGFRTVYWTLVIPTYVPIEKLPSAMGIQSAFNSVFVCIGGPFLGMIRDMTGSFTGCIIVINCVTATTITLWTTELVYKYFKSKKKTEELEENKM